MRGNMRSSGGVWAGSEEWKGSVAAVAYKHSPPVIVGKAGRKTGRGGKANTGREMFYSFMTFLTAGLQLSCVSMASIFETGGSPTVTRASGVRGWTHVRLLAK